jgi:hypothetical protein
MMGGGNFVVPAQRVTDFISNKLSGTIGVIWSSKLVKIHASFYLLCYPFQLQLSHHQAIGWEFVHPNSTSYSLLT